MNRREEREKTVDAPRSDGPGGGTDRARGRRPRVLISPFTNTTNAYIEMQKALLAEIGYDVRPLSVRSLLLGEFASLFRRDSVLVFHWLELRAFARRQGGVVLSPKGCLVFAFYCLLIGLARARAIYFVHDHAVHDATGRVRRVSAGMMAVVRALVDCRVVHAPGFAARYRARYLPHPLYWDAPGHVPPLAARRDNPDGPPTFALLGTIRPYKQIRELLEVWPGECRLDIAGDAEPSYLRALGEVVRRRALVGAVTIEPGFLADDAFERRIAAADVLVLPHAADSMLVSGAFFEAIGRVPMLVAFATPFMRWAAGQFGNVRLFDSMDALPSCVRAVALGWPACRGAAASPEAAREAFGWQACRERYRRLFDEVLAGRIDESGAEGAEGEVGESGESGESGEAGEPDRRAGKSAGGSVAQSGAAAKPAIR
ncbi:hypothetical protein [Burkholderia sp. WAC0059]|uniref:hypothetical protein n=1 Tax=Burkholderia sp. WAC0059 TaxID=2066022 RepID=UPI0015E064BA|nr:hypothetical protein [Burkholderia sp. WAC0059]